MGQQKELSFEIISLLPRKSGEAKVTDPSFQPHSIKRKSDGQIFTIGDRVTNGIIYEPLGLPMAGFITGFSFLEDNVYVEHTWSGIGMGLEDISKEPLLPSKFQIRQKVNMIIDSNIINVTILAVHFHSGGHEKYDIELNINKTRLYNVDSKLLSAL